MKENHNSGSLPGRKTFLKVSGLTALAAGLSLSLKKQYLKEGLLNEYIETRMLMGTTVTLQLTAAEYFKAKHMVKDAFLAMESLVNILDHRQDSSALAVLNRQGKLDHPPGELLQVIREAQNLGELTGGALDITIQPALEHFRREKTRYPHLREQVDYRSVDCRRESISFRKKGMAITLDAVGKGWIIDQITDFLRNRGFTNTLVEAGGDLYLAGSKRDGSAWRVGLQHPREGIAAVVEGMDQAIATSGDYHHAYDSQYINHHIVDPRTGLSPRSLAGVSVFAPTACQADGLSTALMVMGLKEGLAFVEKLPRTEALMISKTLDLYPSSGLSKLLVN
ncbi:MAG: FAD:protein FMN transferase [Anaerolineales bacterium]|nr:FAD:protein FMN transferase [Anaerolineales bacterium]